VEFARVLHVPALCNNLLSVLYLTKHKAFDVHISGDHMDFIRNGTTLFTAFVNECNVGYLNGSTIDISESANLSSTLPLDLWHKRLAHHNYDDIKMMIPKNLVDGLVLESKTKPDPICEPCLAGKMHANPFPSSNSRATELLELVHSDVYPVGHPSHGCHIYWATFLDDCSRKKVVVPMKQKSDTLDAFKRFKAYTEKQTGKTLKRLREDKCGEYMSTEFDTLLKSCGIVREHSVRNRPQQNGVTERANRLLISNCHCAKALSCLMSMFRRMFW